MKNRYRHVMTLACAATVAACTASHPYTPPAIEAPPQFMAQDVFTLINNAKESGGSNHLATRWWQGFNDNTLNLLVSHGIEQNLTVAAAAAGVQQAQAQLKLAGASNSPTTGLQTTANAATQTGNGTTTTHSGTIGLNVGVPVDVFGRTRRQVEVAEANLAAAEADLRREVLATGTAITASYLTLRGNQRQLALLQQSVDLQEKTLTIVQARYRAGLSPNLDLQRAIASVESLRARIPPLEQSLQDARNRLATLTGQFPGVYEELLQPEGDIPVYRAAIPTVLPLDVLNMRADVQAAEARLKAAMAAIGVAESDYYPQFSLAGGLSIGSSRTSGLSATEVLITSLSGLIQQTLSTGGARKATVDVAKAKSKQALATYTQTLHTAVEEVEQALNAIKTSATRQQSLHKAVVASSRSFAQAQTLYKQGLISFLDVVDAQQELADDEQTLAAEQTNYAAAIAQLFNVLGTPDA